MPAIAFMFRGREGADPHRAELIEGLTGEAGKGLHERRRQHGFRRIRVWKQTAPETAYIVYLEADDLEAAMREMAADSHEHNVWFAQQIEKITGRNPHDRSERPQSELIVD